jgi:flavin-dependent dehydrogenase
METEKYDIGIIGGGPAGSSAALLLCKAGFNVCLFEKKRFPRETVCGEFLSREVYNFFDENGLLERFFSLNPNPINFFKIVFNTNVSVQSELNFTGYGLKRSSLDSFLLNTASEAGTIVYKDSEVTNIVKNTNDYIIEFTSNKNNCYVQCDTIIAAYGKQNILDKKLNRKFINKKSGFNGIKFHFDIEELPAFNRNEIQIYTSDSIYCGINAVNENKVSVCFLENRNRYGLSSRTHLKELIMYNSSFASLLSKKFESLIETTELYGTGNIYFGKRELAANDILMAGDAGRVIAPLAGDGISIALQNARILQKTLLLKREKKLDSYKTGLIYKEFWNKEFRKRILIAFYVQKILFSRNLSKAGSIAIRLFPGILKYLIHNTRG